MKIHVPGSEAASFAPLVKEAEAFQESRDYRQALAAWDKVVSAVASGTFTQGGADQEAEARLVRADLALQLGRWPQVLEDGAAVDALGPKLGDRSLLIHARLLQARIHGYRGRYQDCERLLGEARDLAEEHGDPLDRALVYLELGGMHSKSGQLTAGQRELARARMLASGPVTDARSARVAVLLAMEDGLAAFRQGQTDEARRFYDLALSMSRQYLPRSQYEGDANRLLGIVASVQGGYVAALRNYLRAVELYRELGFVLGQVKVYGSIGQALLELSRVDEALSALNRARKLAGRLGAETEKAALYGKLGNIYREREEFDKAVECHLKDVELARRFGSERSLAFAFQNLGLSYRARGEADEARSYLNDSLERFLALGDRSRAARVRLDLAEVWLEQGHPQEADEQLQAARDYLDSGQSQPDRVRLLLLHGAMLRDLRRTTEAGRDLVEAMRLLGEQQPSALLAEAHYEMARLYQAMADSHQAVEHLKAALALARHLGLNRLVNSVVGLLEQINELELLRLIVQEVERDEGTGRRPPLPGRS